MHYESAYMLLLALNTQIQWKRHSHTHHLNHTSYFLNHSSGKSKNAKRWTHLKVAPLLLCVFFFHLNDILSRCIYCHKSAEQSSVNRFSANAFYSRSISIYAFALTNRHFQFACNTVENRFCHSEYFALYIVHTNSFSLSRSRTSAE